MSESTALARLEKAANRLAPVPPTEEARAEILASVEDLYARATQAGEVWVGNHRMEGVWQYESGTAVRLLELKAKILGCMQVPEQKAEVTIRVVRDSEG